MDEQLDENVAEAEVQEDEVEVAEEEAEQVKGGPRTTAFLVGIA